VTDCYYAGLVALEDDRVTSPFNIFLDWMHLIYGTSKVLYFL